MGMSKEEFLQAATGLYHMGTEFAALADRMLAKLEEATRPNGPFSNALDWQNEVQGWRAEFNRLKGHNEKVSV